MGIKREVEEIEAEIAKASDISEGGDSPFHGMSFEEGIIQMGDWILGIQEESPLEDVPLGPEDEGSVPDV